MQKKFQKRFFGLILGIALLVNTTAVFAQETDDPDTPDYEETYEGMSLCLPGIYLVPPKDCLPLGPSETLTKWAREGVSIPEIPLNAKHPDSSFLPVEKEYAKLNVADGVQAAWYPSIDAAISGWGASHNVPIGKTLYVSYKELAYNYNDAYVQNDIGEWIRASPTYYSTFQGLLFNQQPDVNFGWIIDTIKPAREPSTFAEVVDEEFPPQYRRPGL